MTSFPFESLKSATYVNYVSAAFMFVSTLFTQPPLPKIIFSLELCNGFDLHWMWQQISAFGSHNLQYTVSTPINCRPVERCCKQFKNPCHYSCTFYITVRYSSLLWKQKCPYPCIRYYFNMHITTYNVIRNAMHRLYHCVQYFQNIVKTYSTILLASVRKVWPSFFSHFTPSAHKLSVFIHSRNPRVWTNLSERRRDTKWINTKFFCIWGKIMIS